MILTLPTHCNPRIKPYDVAYYALYYTKFQSSSIRLQITLDIPYPNLHLKQEFHISGLEHDAQLAPHRRFSIDIFSLDDAESHIPASKKFKEESAEKSFGFIGNLKA
ncbi:hypothetical protein JTB14_020578 [Gonioctena quinquepunctata]|nr:hypothetical protein JTB14_020578 [Gonioctena quinquepunctata]